MKNAHCLTAQALAGAILHCLRKDVACMPGNRGAPANGISKATCIWTFLISLAKWFRDYLLKT